MKAYQAPAVLEQRQFVFETKKSGKPGKPGKPNVGKKPGKGKGGPFL